MKKLIVSMNITLDGYLSGADCNLDWHFRYWSVEMGDTLCSQLSLADTVLLGRVTYDAMAKYWPAKAMEPQCPRDDIAFAVMMNNYAKVVYSNTLRKTAWNNSRVIRGDIRRKISQLKKSGQAPDKNIIIFGSARLVSALIHLKLVDEFHLYLHPVILGKGKSMFNSLPETLTLKMMHIKRLDSGVVLLQYNLKQA